MASFQLLKTTHSDHHHQNQVQNCSSSSSSSYASLRSETQRGCSKAQNCLFKILRIISTVPPHDDNNNSSEEKLNGCNGFAAIDLNVIGFNNVLPEEKTEEESGSPVDGGFVSASASASTSTSTTADEKCAVAADCGGEDGGDKSCKSDTCVVQLQYTENQEIVQILKLENNGISEMSKSEEEIGEELKDQQGFMGLLIEAATLIFGDFNDEIPKSDCLAETKSFKSESTREKLQMDDCHDDHYKCYKGVGAVNKQVKRRNSECTEEVIIENKSSYPLVRSKRGRIQVLPNKYKDSILEPLTPFSRIRSTIVPSRRRSK